VDEGVLQLVVDQMADVQAQHPALELVRTPAGEVLIRGEVGFCVDHSGCTVADVYQLEIALPSAYPRVPPTVRETGGAIPDDYHRFLDGGRLCLGAPVEVRRAFAEHRTLLGFINRQVIPYLFSYSWFRSFGQLPYGELRHGIQGVLDYYAEHFEAGMLITLRLLKYLADFEFPQDEQCPCGSHRALCLCHGRKVLELWGHQCPEEFAVDLVQIILLYAMLTNPLDDAWWALYDLMPKRCPSLLEFWSEQRKASRVAASSQAPPSSAA